MAKSTNVTYKTQHATQAAPLSKAKCQLSLIRHPGGDKVSKIGGGDIV